MRTDVAILLELEVTAGGLALHALLRARVLEALARHVDVALALHLLHAVLLHEHVRHRAQAEADERGVDLPLLQVDVRRHAGEQVGHRHEGDAGQHRDPHHHLRHLRERAHRVGAAGGSLLYARAL